MAQHVASPLEIRPSEPTGLRPELGWEELRKSVLEMGGDLGRYRDCAEVERVMGRVRDTRAALDRLEQALEGAHLTCCILPGAAAPDELFRALAGLARRGIGGLVVVERAENLDAYIERGTALDAQLSANLLESLFYPGSTLHDGAVIVRGTRIMAAGVFLPVLGERRDPSHGRLLGGRHRAALAMSRLTDAMVFVVSEETREVALAVHGALHAGLPIAASFSPDVAGPPPSALDDANSRLGRLRSVLGSLVRRRPADS